MGEVAIVGGGLGGLTTALALARQGIASRVLERKSNFDELGAGIQLGPNATRVLRALDVFEAAAADSVYPAQLVFKDAVTGRQINRVDLGTEFQERFGAPYLLMHRGDLLSALFSACVETGLVTLEADRDVVDIEDRETAATVSCVDGSRYEADLLIAADGLWSKIRAHVVDDEPVSSDYVAYRSGAVDVSQLNHEPELDSMVMWLGPQMHVVQYPLRRGELYNQVAVFNSTTQRPGDAAWSTPEEVKMHYPFLCQEIQQAVPLLKRDRYWPMYDREPILQWVQNRIVLLGDAAHPMLQYVAQGACQAIEDGAALASTLADHRDNVSAGLRAYQDERVPRTARVQRMARLWGDICHVAEWGRDLRNAALSFIEPRNLDYLDSLYGGGPIATAHTMVRSNA